MMLLCLKRFSLCVIRTVILPYLSCIDRGRWSTVVFRFYLSFSLSVHFAHLS